MERLTGTRNLKRKSFTAFLTNFLPLITFRDLYVNLCARSSSPHSYDQQLFGWATRVGGIGALTIAGFGASHRGCRFGLVNEWQALGARVRLGISAPALLHQHNSSDGACWWV